MQPFSQEVLERATAGLAPAVRYLPECDSTNRVAMAWASKGAPEGCVVVADHQTAGRGRMGRGWFDLPGGFLLFSVVLRPGIPAGDLGLVGLAAAVALGGCLTDHGLDPRVRWPNDVLVGGRKVAGILSESELAAGDAATVVLGVGLNVNGSVEDLPEDIRQAATTLAEATGRPLDRLPLLAGFLRHFRARYAALGEGPAAVLAAYRGLCETLGRRVRIVIPGRTLEATAVDLDPGGGLVLDGGEVVRVGDVVHLA